MFLKLFSPSQPAGSGYGKVIGRPGEPMYRMDYLICTFPKKKKKLKEKLFDGKGWLQSAAGLVLSQRFFFTMWWLVFLLFFPFKMDFILFYPLFLSLWTGTGLKWVCRVFVQKCIRILDSFLIVWCYKFIKKKYKCIYIPENIINTLLGLRFSGSRMFSSCSLILGNVCDSCAPS